MHTNFNMYYSQNSNSTLAPNQQRIKALNQKKRLFATLTEDKDIQEIKPNIAASRYRCLRNHRPTILRDFLRNVLNKIITPLPHATKHNKGLENPCLIEYSNETKDNISMKTFAESNIDDMTDKNIKKNRRNKRSKRRSRNRNKKKFHAGSDKEIKHNLPFSEKNLPTELDKNKRKSDLCEGFAIVTLQTAFCSVITDDNNLLFSPEDFPPISHKNKSTPLPDQSQLDCVSDDDDFIIFRNDAPKSTRSVVAKPSNLCGKISKILTATSPKLKMSLQTSAGCVFPSKRERLMSECSDDSFVVFFDPDCPTTSSNFGDDFENLSGNDNDSDDSSENECIEKEIKILSSKKVYDSLNLKLNTIK